jgi:hypothetical protein
MLDKNFIFPHRCLEIHRRNAKPSLSIHGSMIRGKLSTGRRTGRSLPEILAQAGVAGRGKSELRRAVCRITSGTRASKPADGECHRKYTAPVTPPASFRSGGLPGTPNGLVQRAAPRSGKGEKVR